MLLFCYLALSGHNSVGTNMLAVRQAGIEGQDRLQVDKGSANFPCSSVFGLSAPSGKTPGACWAWSSSL